MTTRTRTVMDDAAVRLPLVMLCLPLLLLLACSLTPCAGNAIAQDEDVYMATCRQDLGMQTGLITDNQLSASSSYDEKSVGPFNARIRTEKNGGAWCPREPVSRDSYEWLQVDFNQLTVISLVETQGRFGNGQGQEYAPQYALEYQRLDNEPWIRHKTKAGAELLEGNINTYTPQVREVNPPIIARRLRFVPYSSNTRTVCMRVEVYGCPWDDGLVSYSMIQGDGRGQGVDFLDDTYDGVVSANNTLSGGLGQLTDHEVGYYNFRLDLQGVGKKGYEWVGWRNDTRPPNTPIEITFEFDRVRNFTSVRLHVNNMFTKEVRVFRRAELHFSVGGRYYVSEPIVYETLRDVVIEFARYVTIPLPQMIGRYVKLLLYFDARWIMLSEVTFESEIVLGHVPVETAPFSENGQSTPRAQRPANRYPQLPMDGDEEEDEEEVLVRVIDAAEADDRQTSEVPVRKRELNDTQVGIIIGALGALVFLLAATISLLVIRRRRGKKAKKHQPFFHAGSRLPPLHCSADEKLCSTTTSRYSPVGTSDSDETKCSQQNLPQLVYSEPRDSVVMSKSQEAAGLLYGGAKPVRAPSITDCDSEGHPYSTLLVTLPGGSKQYATVAGECDSSIIRPLPPLPASSTTSRTPSLYARGLTPPFSLPASSSPAMDMWLQELCVPEFPRHNLHSLEKLGEGQFGEVHLCEAVDIASCGECDMRHYGSLPRSTLVAVKILRQDASEAAKNDFHKEVRIMSRLKDANIVHVLGVCLHDEPLAVIIEYMPHGDLNEFLLRHQLEDGLDEGLPLLSYGALIYMATQIASGMKYLESLNMVHRDLASRNCLVGDLYTIKISDFGMSRSLYSSDYYRIEGKAILPIRWMAWESTLLGKFSCKSDTWSFAVTLWETLTLARCQPFDMLSDEEVIDNFGHYFHGDGREIVLSQPACCPREIYDLMTECWNRDEKQRPSFREIHMFLLRKNMGYDPAVDIQATGGIYAA